MKAIINFKNAEEFQKLLGRAATLSEQLQETLQQINDFELDIEVNKTVTAATAAPTVDLIAKNIANQIEKNIRSIT
ncbi:hypothetical protein [Bacillus sp. JJ1474]|uniref:hypothetical protein n=1 Tax=Bacillus sp. JJ1474 TaxID=3122955 RepID=UPI002FFEB997